MVKIAQIGVGYWGKNLARNFHQIQALHAIVENDAASANFYSNAFNVPVRSFDEVLFDPEVDGVAIATPAVTHAQLAMKALRHGKHVFVEKPLALSITDAERVIETARDTKRNLMIGHLLQYHPLYIELKKRVWAGEIGEIQHIHSTRFSLGKFRAEENVWWSFAPHDLSMVLGILEQEPVEIYARGSGFAIDNIEDWVSAIFKFKNGISAHVNVSWMHPFKEQRLVVSGTKGSIVFEDSHPDWNKKLVLYPSSVDLSHNGPPEVTKGDPQYITMPYLEPLKEECKHFIDCIKNSTTPLTDGEEGLRVLKALKHGQESLMDASYLKGRV